MKKYIVWGMFAIAFIVAIVETFYGDPSRLFIYALFFISMWGASKIVSKIDREG